MGENRCAGYDPRTPCYGFYGTWVRLRPVAGYVTIPPGRRYRDLGVAGVRVRLWAWCKVQDHQLWINDPCRGKWYACPRGGGPWQPE